MKLLRFLRKKVFLTTKLRSKNNYILILFLIVFSASFAQNEAIPLKGIVKNDSVVLQDINIVNKTSKLGTSSNFKGEFIMYAKLGDSIQFSSINYTTRIVLVSINHIKNKQITVFLEPGLNELKEIEITQKFRLDFGNLTLPKGAILDFDKADLKKAPNARLLTDPTSPAGSNTGNIFGIITLITDKIFEKSRQRKKEELKMEQVQQNFPETMLDKYGEDFYTKSLNIDKNDVYLFIDYCTDNGLKEYYLSDEFTTKNFLVLQSKKFLKLKKE